MVTALTVATRLVAKHSQPPCWSLLSGCSKREPLDNTVYDDRGVGPIWEEQEVKVRNQSAMTEALSKQKMCYTLLQVIFGAGSPMASQGIINSRPTSWRYSGRGGTRNVGGSLEKNSLFISLQQQIIIFFYFKPESSNLTCKMTLVGSDWPIVP